MEQKAVRILTTNHHLPRTVESACKAPKTQDKQVARKDVTYEESWSGKAEDRFYSKIP